MTKSFASCVRSHAETAAATWALALVLLASAFPSFAQCVPVGASPSCAVLITINPTGALSIQVKSTRPYDGADDALVGVVNKSGATVFGISVSGNSIFGFDGDGLCTFITCAWPHPTGYEGRCSDGSCNVTFTPATVNSGVVNFTGTGLVDGGSAFFSLEQAPQATSLAATVTIDPGHGHTCAPPDDRPIQHQGTTGGGLSEDDLTVPVALAVESLLKAASYSVILTKRDVNSCPTLLDRAKKANDNRSDVFVSVHFDRPISSLPFFKRPFARRGSLGIYNSQKSSAQTLAGLLSSNVASQLGINNRGTKEDNSVAVIGPAPFTSMTASLIEVGRLDGEDLTAISAPGSAAKAASGIKAAIDAFIKQ
jgi:N-acetylmuramoyl-L-alanine amidase